MPGSMRKLTAFAVGISLMSVTTAAVASAPAPTPAPVTSTTSVSPWVALGAMNSSSAATAASTAAAQDYRDDGMGFPPIAVLAIILATLAVGIWILVDDDDDDDGFDFTPDPVSPN